MLHKLSKRLKISLLRFVTCKVCHEPQYNFAHFRELRKKSDTKKVFDCNLKNLHSKVIEEKKCFKVAYIAENSSTIKIIKYKI